MGAAASVSPPDVPAEGADRAGMRALLRDRFDEARFAALVGADGRVSAAAFQRAWAASCLGPGVMTVEEAEAVAKRDGKLVVYDPDSKLATVADVRVPRQSPRRPPPHRRRAADAPTAARRLPTAHSHRAPAGPPQVKRVGGVKCVTPQDAVVSIAGNPAIRVQAEPDALRFMGKARPRGRRVGRQVGRGAAAGRRAGEGCEHKAGPLK